MLRRGCKGGGWRLEIIGNFSEPPSVECESECWTMTLKRKRGSIRNLWIANAPAPRLSARGMRRSNHKAKGSLSERLVYFLVEETGGTQDSPVDERVYESLVAVLTAFCLCDPEPLAKAQEVCGDIQRTVTERVIGEG